MGCRGVLFAITDDTVAALLAAEDDDAVMAIVEQIEEAWDKAHLEETDKAWDAMHRALSDGTLDINAGTPPLNRALLGGRHLHRGEAYIVALVDKADVPTIARALARVDIGERYDTIVPPDYSGEYGEDDRAYTVDYFAGVVDFYTRAAKAGRAVIFTVDQ